MAQRGFFLQTCFVIIVCYVLATVEGQKLPAYIPNVGVETGEQNVSLACNLTFLPQNNYIVWAYSPSWQSTRSIVIYSTFDHVNNDPFHFTVNEMTPVGDTQSVELVINMVTPELAAHYQCYIEIAPNGGVNINLIALDPVECPSGGFVEYDEYSVANISCSINFYDSSLHKPPIIRWYRDGLIIFSGVEIIIESDTRRTAILTMNLTTADDNQEFICIVDFRDLNLKYTDNCSTIVKVMRKRQDHLFSNVLWLFHW